MPNSEKQYVPSASVAYKVKTAWAVSTADKNPPLPQTGDRWNRALRCARVQPQSVLSSPSIPAPRKRGSAAGVGVAKGSLAAFDCDFNPADAGHNGGYNGFAVTTRYVLGPSALLH